MSEQRKGIAFGILFTYLQHFAKGNKIEWFYSDKTGWGTFDWCCRELGLSPDGARLMLKKMSPAELIKTLEQFVAEEESVEEA